MARPAASFVLTLADAEILQGWLRMTSQPQSFAQRHRAKAFLASQQQIDRSIPAELDLHVILDNSSTHKTAAVKA